MTKQPNNPHGLHPSEVHDEVQASDYGAPGSGLKYPDRLEMFSRSRQFTIQGKF